MDTAAVEGRDVEKLDIARVINLYLHNSNLSKRYLIERAGKILLLSGHKCFLAEMFLRDLILADWTDEKGTLAPAMAVLENDRVKKYQAKKIKEDCFAFLSVFQKRMQPKTQLVLDELAANPPYPEFMCKVREKMEEFKKAIQKENERSLA